MMINRRMSEGRAVLHRLLEGSPLRRRGTIAALLLLLPLCLMIVTETLHRGSLTGAFEWLTDHSQVALFNYVLYFSLLALLYAIVGPIVWAAGLMSLLVTLMALISYFKLKFIGEPFFPWDLRQNKEGLNIFPYISSFSSAAKLSVLLLGIVGVFLLRLIVPKLSMSWPTRLVLGVLAACLVYGVGVQAGWAGSLSRQLGYKEIVWNQEKTYADNGLMVAFIMNVKHSIIERPDGYSDKEMSRIAQVIAQEQASPHGMEPDGADMDNGLASPSRPHVIFIMNEAFWDPTVMPEVTFSEDPIPTVRKLQQSFTSGNLLSPQFGGGTSNAEFEVLSGLSMSLLPQGAVPYQQYIGDSLPSLASYFASQGYYSMGIHPYDGWFWSRNRVYRSLGFERFRSKTGFENPQMRGFYISDKEVTEHIIDEVRTSERPMFIYAVTMQNHGPYTKQRYKEHEVQVEGQLTEEARQILETYTQGVRDADNALAQLIAYFEQSNEPVIIVFYGDHLPMLGAEYSVYVQGGLISSPQAADWSLEERKRMRSVPFVTWSNLAMERQVYPVLSNTFLGSVILDSLQMKKPAQFALGARLARELPGMTGPLYADSQEKLYSKIPDQAASLVNDFRLLQYDLLFGKRYVANAIDSEYIYNPPQENYKME